MVSSSSDYLLLLVVAVVAYWLGANSSLVSLGPHNDNVRVDPATGIEFQLTERFPFAPKSSMSLVGVGTRKLAVINLYSLGLYIGSNAAKSLPSATDGTTKCDAILTSKAHKAVKLTFSMGIGPEKIAEALSAVNAEQSVKEEFRKLILGSMNGKMLKGESMTLEWKGNDVISVSIRGKYVGEIQDKALAIGVLELYVGPKSVSPSLRKNLGCI